MGWGTPEILGDERTDWGGASEVLGDEIMNWGEGRSQARLSFIGIHFFAIFRFFHILIKVFVLILSLILHLLFLHLMYHSKIKN